MNKYKLVLLGANETALHIAQNFYHKYEEPVIICDKKPFFSQDQKTEIISFLNFDHHAIFITTLTSLGIELNQKYEKTFLIACQEVYANLLNKNRLLLLQHYQIPYIPIKINQGNKHITPVDINTVIDNNYYFHNNNNIHCKTKK